MSTHPIPKPNLPADLYGSPLGLDTNMVHGGILRSQFSETSEALFLTQGYVYDSPEQAEERFKSESAGSFIRATQIRPWPCSRSG